MSVVQRICFIVVLITMVSLVQCGGGGSIGGSATGDGIDALSDAESGLYETGPVEIPVTIAKLESPDATKIIASADGYSPNIITEIEGLEPAMSSPSVSNPTVAYTITGAEDSIRYPKITPYVYLYNSVNGADEFCEVSSDGSFTCPILGDLGDDLLLFASTETVVVDADMSPPLYITMDELGVVAIGDTNAGSLSADFSVATDNLGNYYLVVENTSTNKSNFYRRNVDGTLLQTIWTEDDSEGSIIPTKIEAIGSSFIYVVDDDGSLYQIQVAETSSSISDSFLKGRAPLFALSTTSSAVTRVNENLNSFDPNEAWLQVVYDQNDKTEPAYLLYYYPLNVSTNNSVGVVMSLDDVNGLDSLTADLETSEIIPGFGIEDMSVAYGTNGDGMAIISDTDITGCSEAEPCLGEIIRDAANWDSEEYDDMEIFVDPELPGNVVKVYPSTMDPSVYYIITTAHVYMYGGGDSVQISTQNNPSSLVMSNDGTYFFGCCDGAICAYDEDDNDFEVVWEGDEILCDANNPPDIDINNNVHFYNALGQHTGLYQNANANIFEDVVRRPPRATAACDHMVTDSVNASAFDTFCACWIDSYGISTSTSCSTYYNACVDNDKTSDIGECYYYIRETYSEMGVGF
jgi:hypothetical protein